VVFCDCNNNNLSDDVVLREMKMNFVASLLYPGIKQNNVHDLLLKKMYVVM